MTLIQTAFLGFWSPEKITSVLSVFSVVKILLQ